MKLNEYAMQELKDTIDCHLVLGEIPPFTLDSFEGIKTINNKHIEYLKKLIGRKRYGKIGWYQKFELIEHMKK